MKLLSIVCMAAASVGLPAQASVPKALHGTWAVTQITGKAVPTGPHTGKIQLGLAQLSGDTLTLSLGEPGSTTRPANVDQSLVLNRIKPLPAELAGSWEGTLVTSTGQQLVLVIKLTNGADGLATGTLVSVDQAKEAPISGVMVMGSKLKLIVPAVRGVYEGELKDQRLTGNWSHATGSLPLVLTRAK